MELKQVDEILSKIDDRYNTNKKTDMWINKEWKQKLKDYDYEDIIEKLEQHFSSEYNTSAPKLEFLIKFIPTIEDKKRGIKNYKVKCSICGNNIYTNQLDKHMDRCSSIALIKQKNKKYFNKETNIEELLAISEEEFIIKYKKFIQILIDKDILPHIHRNLLNAIEGKAQDFSKMDNVFGRIYET